MFNPHSFEEAFADLFKKLKYEVERTPLNGDYGEILIHKKGYMVLVIQA